MRTLPSILGRLLVAATACLAVCPSAGQTPVSPPASRPIASQPVDPADGAWDADDGWDDPAPPTVLTTAAEVRALAPEQAAAGRKVRVRGVVTYLSVVPPLMFVRDATGGVCVSAPRDREIRTQLRIGSTVWVEGVTARGGDVPYVTSPDARPIKIDVMPPGRMPVARQVTVAQLATAALHGEMVDVEAVVRSVRAERVAPTGPGATVLMLAQGNARVEAVLMGRAGEAIVRERYVGATVLARGVFNAAAPERSEIAAMRLLLRNIRVRAPAAPSTDLPVVPIRSLGDAVIGETKGRTRVRGVVTLALAGRGLFVQDDSGAVWVEGPARNEYPSDDPAKADVDPRPGDLVEAVGFPDRRGWSAVLSDAAATITGKMPAPAAPLITSAVATTPEMDARLVRIDARVLSVSRPSQFTTLVLQDGARVFLARLADPAASAPATVSDGSWVRVTGVCVQIPLGEAWADTGAAKTGPARSQTAGGMRAPAFHLLVPSADAVQLIRAPGWWTPRRVLVVCGVLAAVAAAAIAWNVLLRRRVVRQTGLIREHLAKGALYEERVRIARDLHDSLEQDLLGITMQLNATEKLLTQPERARQSLHLAAAMVRRSQAETHRAVWDLRDGRPERDGLVAAIREAVAGLSTPHGGDATGGNRMGGDGDGVDATRGRPRVEVTSSGEAHALPPQVGNHLLRVALEAVTNAVKHSSANRIEVALAFAPDHVKLCVRDDGRGFDAEHLPPPSSGHFGLFGMRERAEKLGGMLSIRSRAGEGTEIRLVVPLNSNGAPAGNVSTGAAAVKS